MSKEDVVAYFEILYRYSPTGAVEIYRVPHSEYPVPAENLEPHVSKIQLRIITTGKNLPDRNITFPCSAVFLNDIQFVIVTHKFHGGI